MKKRIVIVALLVCILVLSIASTTIAYFTDTKAATNTFTVGDVEITLSEADPTNSNALTVVDGDDAGFTYENVYPTQTIVKTPTITNVATDPAYVGAIITLKNTGADANTWITKIISDEATAKAILLGGAINDANNSVKWDVNTTTGVITIYVINTATVAKNGTVMLFDSVKIPAKWDTAEMEIFKTLTITVDAYATQTVGFDSAVAAFQGAFGGGADATNGDFANSGLFTNP